MASDLPEDAIESFISFTSATRQQAIAFLEANNRDSNRAINAYFENPDSAQPEPQVSWPMPPSRQQEGYGYHNQDVPTFRIDSDPVHPSAYSTAPSRPPSRVGAREDNEEAKLGQPMEGSLNKSTEGTGGSGQSQQMSLAEQEEQELQRAVALSLNSELGGNGDISIDAGNQETGVVRSENTKFAPATRSHYEETSWALTLLDPAVREECIHPDPEERKKINDEPAFLRPSDDADYLAGFLTILHSIPLAREALLLRDKVIDDYGSDAQWWNGQPINLPSSITLADDEFTEQVTHDDVLIEAQRLMAFLDGTNRAFGSADALASIKTVQCWTSEYNVGRFLETWQREAVAATPSNQLATIFSSLAYKRPFSVDEEPIDKEFFALELPVDSDQMETLYDVIDLSMWQDSSNSEFDDIWLDRIGEVFALRLNSTGTMKSVDVKIPAVWYPDRYMEACRDISRDIRKRRVETGMEIEKLQTLMERFSTTIIDNSPYQMKNTFDLAINALQVAARNNLINGSLDDADEKEQPIVSHEAAQGLANELKALAEKIDLKLKSLEHRKSEALDSLRRYSKELTAASDDPAKPPYNKYTLRGVCTQPHVTYILRPRRRSTDRADGTSANQTSSDGNGWQWWRISFSVDDARARHAEATQTLVVPSVPLPNNADVAGYTARPVREIEVLRAARDEAGSVLLVYANENAVNFKERCLPPQLQAFVDADNQIFESEIQELNRKLQEQQQEEGTAPSSERSWPDLEPLGGQSDTTTTAQTQQTSRTTSWASKGKQNAHTGSNHKKQRSYDERLPASLMQESNPSTAVSTNTSATNVFDYEISSFPNTPPSEPEEREPEMQERVGTGAGRGILGHGGGASNGNNPARFSMPPPGSMGRIREEADDSGSGSGSEKMQVEYERRASRAA
ncbi:hypothetical protein AJ79_04363 [Helicocarpus griseus UAMH5409]|uniref:Ubiquitin interaction motif protein n=1 Tax=Helicocarpus griseus UAMH5409 TaxID=1447875 RepID=A0A2B7XUZ1_9EURO|nr:hypothetical protein AJ79_04363 [Helicocarpus griseus UAMH5409]